VASSSKAKTTKKVQKEGKYLMSSKFILIEKVLEDFIAEAMEDVDENPPKSLASNTKKASSKSTEQKPTAQKPLIIDVKKKSIMPQTGSDKKKAADAGDEDGDSSESDQEEKRGRKVPGKSKKDPTESLSSDDEENDKPQTNAIKRKANLDNIKKAQQKKREIKQQEKEKASRAQFKNPNNLPAIIRKLTLEMEETEEFLERKNAHFTDSEGMYDMMFEDFDEFLSH
jgi:hypothetical protein